MPADRGGGGGGLSVDVDDVISFSALAGTLGPRSPLDRHKGWRDVYDPRVPASGGTLSFALSTTPPGKLAISFLPPVLALTAVCPEPGTGGYTPPPPKVFLWPHIPLPHTEG